MKSKPKWTRKLLAWYSKHHRPLPWRLRSDPYAIWVSEIMLQQTQVATVIPYYERFLTRFPTLASLAAAPLDDVLKQWEGLGYYSRARNLHRAAVHVVRDLGGKIPRSYKELQELPGLGFYTAAAVASIAFEEPVPVVDGNVLRVMSRFWAKDFSSPVSLFNRLVPWIASAPPSEFNQALMELGALVCAPREPRCLLCPIRVECQAFHTGCVDKFPKPKIRKPRPHLEVAVGVIRRRGKILIAKRKPDQLLGGLWEFPGGKRKGKESLKETAQREILEETGLSVSVGDPITTLAHGYTHFSISLTAFECTAPAGRARPLTADEVRWVKPEALARYAFPRANQKLIPLITVGTARGHSTGAISFSCRIKKKIS